MSPRGNRGVLELSFLREINWSVLRGGIPFVWSLKVHNADAKPLGAFTLRMAVPGYLECADIRVPALPSGAVHEVRPKDLAWRVDYDAAARRHHTADEFLHVTNDGRTARHLVQILAIEEWYAGVAAGDDALVPDDRLPLIHWTIGLDDANTLESREGRASWVGKPELQACAAALILPDHLAVQRIRTKAMQLLTAIADAPRLSLDEHLGGGALERSQLMQATFHAVAQLLPTTYHDIEKFSPRLCSQRVRFPHDASGMDGSCWPGATCIDFVLLVAAALESVGLDPLLLLLGTASLGCHAMVGAWLSDPEEEVLLTDAMRVRQAVAAGKVRVVDVTEFAHNRGFKEACELGSRLLRECRVLYALDVRAARRAYGIEPLPLTSGPRGDPPPPPPPPRLVHALPPARDFQGRRELEAIAEFWRGQRPGGVLCLEGMGGSGKTALVERFLCELPGTPFHRNGVAKRTDLPRPRSLLVWSFYEATDAGEFVAELFDYFCSATTTPTPPGPGRRPRSPASIRSRGSKAGSPSLTSRLTAVQQAFAAGQRALVVLDGLERIQHEKHSFGRFREEATAIRQLLQWIAQHPSGVWVIATSRLPLTDIQDWQDNGYVRVAVGELEPAVARALLRVRGVSGTDAQLDALGTEFGWHALTLTHLGGLLKLHGAGDPARTADLPPLTYGDGAQAAKIARILGFYENLLSPEATAVLKIVSVFRGPMTEEAVTAAGSAGRLLDPQLPRYEVRSVFQRLCELQLLQEHLEPDGTRRYGVHPAIGQYFYTALGEDTILAHEGVERYLERQVGPGAVRLPVHGAVRTRGAARLCGAHRTPLPTEPKVLDLLEEMVYHALAAGHGEDAFTLYRDRLGGFEHLGRALGDYSRGLRLTSLFLPPSPTALPQDSPHLARLQEDHDRFVKALDPGMIGKG